MLIRIVKLGFHKENVSKFLNIFENSKDKIRNTEGCRLLELYRDKNDDTIFFTYSHWDEDIHLENYRNSAYFKKVWKNTKPLFNRKPEAWSVDRLERLD
ncbi:putative quinol monooxygenase [Urechidicola croceus]|uniref:Antibiotic biosynthesis monooxygenase n=1 Tax=Urechidicola croceus TaxID=1850246 RepID=A0A1D8P651_9FLAO|nr:antibiotic biosynthesis monooxygenase [Urechidicola croceus]AOW20053.1 antibiotic biosynthesis monooxygenase [Urechidicola croceus]